MQLMEINMKSLFESLLRLYEFDRPAPAVTKAEAPEGIDTRLLNVPAKAARSVPDVA